MSKVDSDGNMDCGDSGCLMTDDKRGQRTQGGKCRCFEGYAPDAVERAVARRIRGLVRRVAELEHTIASRAALEMDRVLARDVGVSAQARAEERAAVAAWLREAEDVPGGYSGPVERGEHVASECRHSPALTGDALVCVHCGARRE